MRIPILSILLITATAHPFPTPEITEKNIQVFTQQPVVSGAPTQQLQPKDANDKSGNITETQFMYALKAGGIMTSIAVASGIASIPLLHWRHRKKYQRKVEERLNEEARIADETSMEPPHIIENNHNAWTDEEGFAINGPDPIPLDNNKGNPL